MYRTTTNGGYTWWVPVSSTSSTTTTTWSTMPTQASWIPSIRVSNIEVARLRREPEKIDEAEWAKLLIA